MIDGVAERMSKKKSQRDAGLSFMYRGGLCSLLLQILV